MVFFFFFCVHGRGVEVDSFLLLPNGVPRGLISWVKGSFFFACVRAMWFLYISAFIPRIAFFFFNSCMEHDRYEDEQKQTLLYRTVNMAISYHEREEKGGGC
jgi:hypothetical protein